MSNITLGGTPIHISGKLPETGTKAPNFKLVATDLSVKTLNDFAGQFLILNIFPSVDTGVCSASIRKFNVLANSLENTKVLCISKDLPFAMNRLCTSEGLDNVINLSGFRGGMEGYGIEITDSSFQGLYSRAIVVINPAGDIIYTEQVPEIGQEPNYDLAIKSLGN